MPARLRYDTALAEGRRAVIFVGGSATAAAASATSSTPSTSSTAATASQDYCAASAAAAGSPADTAASATPAASAASATPIARILGSYPFEICAFLVEDVEGGQTDIVDFFFEEIDLRLWARAARGE